MASRSGSDTLTAKVHPHHRKVGPCFTRPAYRDGRIKKAVKVYTVSSESSYVILFGLPSINLEQPLKDRCKRFGSVELIRNLSDYPEKELFTDVFLVKMDSVQSARRAKRCLDDSNFYGGVLHVCYAPEFETVAECRVKLHICRRDNARIARKAEFEYTRRLAGLDLRENPATETASNPIGSEEDAQLLSLPPPLKSLDPVAPLLDSCCAEDDSRHYWLSKGASFMHSLISSYSTNGTSDQSHSQASLQFPAVSSSCSRYSNPVPLPVLQALSWRPYSGDPLLVKQETRTQKESSCSSQVTSAARPPSTSGQFLPRCLLTGGGNTASQTHSTSKPSTSQLPGALTLGGLKQLALTLRDEQGPSIFPPSCPNPPAAYCKSSIVFHRCEAKRQRFSNSSQMTDLRSNFDTNSDAKCLTTDTTDSIDGNHDT